MISDVIGKLKRKSKKISYSQCGEDIIIDFVFSAIGISKPIYLDVGAHHPSYLSNTYLFYLKGCHGVCVEPDPNLWQKISRKRNRDVCLNVGAGVLDQKSADFYIMTTKTLNTFSRVEAERYQGYGNEKIEKVIKIPLLPINDIVRDYFSSCPNLISLDVEGLDLSILKTFDFCKYRPQVFCIETLSYVEDKSEEKIIEIIELMKNNDYMVYADTYINTVFVDISSWKNR